MIKLYKYDLIHKIILHICGIDDLTHVIPVSVNIEKLNELIKIKYPLIFNQLEVNKEVLTTVLENTHNKVFFNKPILTIE